MNTGTPIPFFHKRDPAGLDCAAVCMQMTLHYFGREWELERVYEGCRILGEVHYALPWGLCLCAEAAGLHAQFVSKQPRKLLNHSVASVARATGCAEQDVRDVASRLIAECEDSRHLSLVQYGAKHRELPENILSAEFDGPPTVIIPSLWWQNSDVHNVALTGRSEDGFFLHDPNYPGGRNQEMGSDAFYAAWHHEATDNDLVVVADRQIGALSAGTSPIT